MLRTKRLGLALAPAGGRTAIRSARAEGKLSQAALVRRLSRHASCERGLWPLECQQQAGRQDVEVQP